MINYIIATFDGKTKTRLLDKFSESVLDKQLTVLYDIIQKKKELGIENKIQQITIVVTPSSKDPYPLYYQKDKWKAMFGDTIVFFEYVGENAHYSYDQWLQAMIAYKNIPYHIIMEDDYCIDPTNYTFDLDIIEMYKRKFPNDIGYLCTWCPNFSPYLPVHAAISNGMISSATISAIDDPLKYFYKLSFNIGAQMNFSFLFTNNNISLQDISDTYSVAFYQSGKKQINIFVEHDQKLFIPVQQLYTESW